MRLTLRTLLAYMDDILDPNDQEELGRKIEASPFATELIHRSRDAVRRLRLSAPEVLGGDSDDLHDGDRNLDANTAAEYLDNTLSPDEVAEFERSCLEAGPHADMLLAEAASCHHILTLVLGEPAEVDADLRQRMYELSKYSAPTDAKAPVEGKAHAEAKQVRIEPSHRTPEVMPAEPAASNSVGRRRVDPDEASVPDYMLEAARARRSARRRLVGALVLAAAVGGGATAIVMSRQQPKVPEYIAKGSGDVDKLIQGVEVGEGESKSDSASTGAATVDESKGDERKGDDGTGGEAPRFVPTPPATQTPATETAEAPPAEVPSISPVTPPVAAPGATEGATGTEAPTAAEAGSPTLEMTPPAIEPDASSVETTPAASTGVGVDASIPPMADPGSTVLPAAGPVTPAANVPAASLPGDTSLPADAGPPVVPAEGAAMAPPAGTEAGVAAPAEVGVQPGAAKTAVPAASAVAQLGAYLGNEDVLLRFDPSAKAWLRLPPRSALASGDQLLVFPTFRTHVVLGKDVNAFLSGGTAATLMTAGEIAGDVRGDFGLAIPYGRVILNSGAAGNRVALALGDEVRVIELGPSSSLAIDVQRRFVPGTNPPKETYPLVVTYYLTTGKASWGGEQSAEGQSAEGQATWTTVDGEDKPPQSIDVLPDWINAEPLSGLDQSARDVVKDALVAGQPVAISLLELTDPSRLGKRIEVRGLAGKCAAQIGEFAPLVKSLSDMSERPKWKDRIETLRDAVARDPSSAEAIAKTFAVDRGQTAAGDLMEMLLGFDSQDVGAAKETVKDGALVRLINWMDNDDLSYRVLASYNVNEITGTTSLGGYRPEHTAQKRKSELRFYWDRLEKGDLLPRAWTPLGWAGK